MRKPGRDQRDGQRRKHQRPVQLHDGFAKHPQGMAQLSPAVNLWPVAPLRQKRPSCAPAANAELSDAPLVATHSNAHAVCATSRNLTDRQLAAIRDTGGVAGLNLATCFLRPDGRESAEMTLDRVKRHIEHMLKLAGEDHVAIGSDFDGATTPKDIGGV